MWLYSECCYDHSVVSFICLIVYFWHLAQPFLFFIRSLLAANTDLGTLVTKRMFTYTNNLKLTSSVSYQHVCGICCSSTLRSDFQWACNFCTWAKVCRDIFVYHHQKIIFRNDLDYSFINCASQKKCTVRDWVM